MGKELRRFEYANCCGVAAVIFPVDVTIRTHKMVLKNPLAQIVECSDELGKYPLRVSRPFSFGWIRWSRKCFIGDKKNGLRTVQKPLNFSVVFAFHSRANQSIFFQ